MSRQAEHQAAGTRSQTAREAQTEAREREQQAERLDPDPDLGYPQGGYGNQRRS